MFATIQQRLGSIVNGVRIRRRSEDRGIGDDIYEKPRVHVVSCSTTVSTKSRWLAHRASAGSRHQPNATTESAEDDDNSLPLLFFLARSWAWEAISFRCTTHPNEVEVQYRDTHGDTCLHWVAFGRPPVSTVKALLSACPELARTPNFAGTLPLHVACSYRASPSVIQEILHRYPEAAAIPDSNGTTPMHHLCDYGSGDQRETIASMRILLRNPHGVKSVLMKDHRYQRRPLYIINARKNMREQERYIELLRDRRKRQRAIRKEMGLVGWNHNLQLELIDRFEDDIRSSYHDNAFWSMASLLVLAEYYLKCTLADSGQSCHDLPVVDWSCGSAVHGQIIDRYFDSDVEKSDFESIDGSISFSFSQKSTILLDHAALGSSNSSENVDSVLPSSESIMLNAFITSRDCPSALLEYAILLYEKQLLIADSTCGQHLPLHVASSMYNRATSNEGSTETISQLLTLLLEGCPEAAAIRDVMGAFPLNLILQHPNARKWQKETKTFWSSGLHRLLDANPLALLESDIFTENPKLWSHCFTLLCQNASTIYAIFRANPTVLSQGI
jgi:Ankyrin repeats (many copies)